MISNVTGVVVAVDGIVARLRLLSSYILNIHASRECQGESGA